MQESKSCALPLGDAPILDYSKNAHSFYTMGESRFIWGGGWDSNPRSSEPQSDALGQLRYIHHVRQFKKLPGAPWGTRTPGPLLRRQMLYPAELTAQFLERMRGIEPPYPAWKAGILPMNYIRITHELLYQRKTDLSTTKMPYFYNFFKNPKLRYCFNLKKVI